MQEGGVKPTNYLKVALAFFIFLPAFFLPHYFRVKYTKFISDIFHLPLIVFGKLSSYLMRQLNVTPQDLSDHFNG